jgi:two-component system, OmpR family, phosphate regulon sensor histidine kinase PhoR
VTTSRADDPEGAPAPHLLATGALEALLRGTSTGFLMITDDRLRILRAGATASRLAERPSEELTGMSLIAAFGSAALDGVAREAVERRTQRQAEVRLGHLSPRTFQVEAMPLRDEGLLLFLQDVTRIRRVEQVRRDFIANISHELRTPLTSIKLIAETLSGGAVDDVETARDFAGQVEREVDHLAQLVDELLELSMIESGEVQLQLDPVPPDAVVVAVVRRMHPMAERSRVRLESQALDAADASVRVSADEGRLEQALVNLVHNAVKFSHPEGRVTVGWEPRAGYVRFVVRDDGIGISASHLERIFERFYKVDRSRARDSAEPDGQELRTGSAGLGLAIVRHIAEAHGGSAGAESQEGHGSTFWVDIPIAPAMAEGSG